MVYMSEWIRELSVRLVCVFAVCNVKTQSNTGPVQATLVHRQILRSLETIYTNTPRRLTQRTHSQNRMRRERQLIPL